MATDTALRPGEIKDILLREIEAADLNDLKVEEVGTVLEVKDGIARIYGLSKAMAGEMLNVTSSETGELITALALNLEEDNIGAVILGDYLILKEGDQVRRTGRVLEVPVGPELIGRVVDSLGRPLDERGPINAKHTRKVESEAPGIIVRQPVKEPLQTGLKAVDSMIPIGRGQRELIIGDRQTGKTAIAIDTIINQKSSGIKCIYVAIGQKQSTIANVVRKLEEHGAMGHTIVVAASASTPAALQYLAAYSGVTMGEYFMDNGQDALIIYDDLSKQAVAYRQISLLLRRPPGREAYPGDVFYLHSRLLERSARVNEEYVEMMTKGAVKGKTGSLTGLPIIETQAGDVTAFVPTNVISITDGQIFVETDLFNAGVRPAMNAGISVSRVGGAAQTDIIKKLGGGIRLALAQYRELAAFSQFASDLDEATRKQLERGQRTQEVMKQKQYAPMSVAEMALTIYAVNNGFMDKVDLKKITAFEAALQAFAHTNYKSLLDGINATPKFSKENEAALKKCIEDFIATGTY
jgi:F-type H+/Na+-transporting ATPase subunit alpha